ncbi:MAG: glutamate--tRNA ligase [Alphaproteobacteria bacterium]
MTAPIVRFAPSPTGFLHIGSARTALFNWLFAKRYGGKMLLRIEDTDRERSTAASVQTILDGMTWLGLAWEGDAISQYARRERHAEVARAMVANGTAYYCYCTPDELDIMRAEQKAKGLAQRYDGRWRDRDPKDAPAGVKPVIRMKAPLTGETVVDDKVKGAITVQNSQLDDMILLRSDGGPTYMHAVVVDDHDMGITHVIRGDDHMTNTFRQVQIYRAMGWDVPVFAHLPMILGPDGAKLSKRHGAPAVGDYRDKGYLPEAVRNYLLRLCWSHGDDEIITTEQAIQWFDLEHIGQSPARFDFTKLDSVNAHYLRLRTDDDLAALIAPRIAAQLGVSELSAAARALLTRAMPELKPRAKTLVELAQAAAFYVTPRPLPMDDGAKKLLTDEGKKHLAALQPQLAALPAFTAAATEELFRTYTTAQGIKLGAIAQPFRAALSGMATSPPIFSVAEILGREEVRRRIDDIL